MFSLIYRAADALRRRGLTANHGRMGEDMAHRYLRGRGCIVVARNYRPPSGHGEIDLVVWHGGQLVFVEVKTRDTAEFGEPHRAVDAEKQMNLARRPRLRPARRRGMAEGTVRHRGGDLVAAAHRLAPRRVPLESGITQL